MLNHLSPGCPHTFNTFSHFLKRAKRSLMPLNLLSWLCSQCHQTKNRCHSHSRRRSCPGCSLQNSSHPTFQARSLLLPSLQIVLCRGHLLLHSSMRCSCRDLYLGVLSISSEKYGHFRLGCTHNWHRSLKSISKLWRKGGQRCQLDQSQNGLLSQDPAI